ncbi:MAG: hypothetical protein JNK05_41265 [Myxococcales bacterium]|nr:hypothetical protein [Myxococcales bacterium]
MLQSRSISLRVCASVVAALAMFSCSEGTDPSGGGDGGNRDGSTNPRPDGSTNPPGDGGFVPPMTCNNNEMCNDGNACTIDTCDTSSRRCRNLSDVTRCECDPACTRRSSGGGMGTNGGWNMMGQNGTDYDAPSGGLIVRANARRADYLWVPNTGESTVSKWDATTRREIARYRVGLPTGECVNRCCWEAGCNMTSRTVVDGFGNAWVANRGFSMQGTVTKIAAESIDCVDRNGNGTIDTSTGPTDVKPYGQDECVVLNVNVGAPNAVLRAIAIDRGDENFPEGYVWVGGGAGGGASPGFKLNPRNGMVIQNVMIPHGAYGAVLAPDGRLWWNGGALAQRFTPMDPATGRMGTTVNGGGYGITVDADGRLWFSQSRQGYDTRTGQFTTLPIQANSRGITVDPMNRVWATVGNNLVNWDAGAFVAGGMVPMAAITQRPIAPNIASASALGADRAGDIWIATYGAGPLWLYETMANRFTTHAGPNRVYTYTDFTGAVRRLVIGTGTYTENFTAECDMPQYAELTFDANTPMGTSLQFALRVADTEAGLSTARVVNLGTTPPATSPIAITPLLMAAGVTPAKYARLTVTFSPSRMPVATPVLRNLGLSWRCTVNPG